MDISEHLPSINGMGKISADEANKLIFKSKLVIIHFHVNLRVAGWANNNASLPL
jgi:hypothetical protein